MPRGLHPSDERAGLVEVILRACKLTIPGLVIGILIHLRKRQSNLRPQIEDPIHRRPLRLAAAASKHLIAGQLRRCATLDAGKMRDELLDSHGSADEAMDR